MLNDIFIYMCKAEMFNRKADSSKSKPDDILKVLNLKPGSKIADIGSGGGYFTLRFAEISGKGGAVFAVDTNKEYLDYIKEAAKQKNLENINYVLAQEEQLDIPDKAFDLMFFRNVYHHLEDRVEYMRSLKPKLKTSGRVAIIEYLPGKGTWLSFRRMFGHNVPKEKIAEELGLAGFNKIEEYNFLPEQSFTVYAAK